MQTSDFYKKEDNMSLIEHTKKELNLAGFFDKEKDFYGGKTGKAVLELIEVFSKQGHSGMSSSVIRNTFNSLASYKTITPLTGGDSEWCEVSDGIFQNNRCSNIFKQEGIFNGQAYNIDGRVFSDDGGKTWFTCKKSCIPITFPYNTNTKSIYIKLNPFQVIFRNLMFNLKKIFIKMKVE